MNRFRRRLLATALCGSSACLPGYSWLAAVSSDARAEPVTLTIAAVGTLITLIKAFSASDGGMSAMLTAIIQNESIILNDLQTIADSLNALSFFVVAKLNDMPQYLEDDRLKGYMDILNSAANGLSLNLAAEKASPDANARAIIRGKYLTLQQQVQDTRGKLQQYPSFYAAISIPLAMSLEIALDYKAGLSSYVPETLRRYLTWCQSVSDRSISNSLMSQLANLAQQHDDAANRSKVTKFGAAFGLTTGTLNGGCFQRTACWKKTSECVDLPIPGPRPAGPALPPTTRVCPEHLEPTAILQYIEQLEEVPKSSGLRELKFTRWAQPTTTACATPAPNRGDCYFRNGPETIAEVQDWIQHAGADANFSPWHDYEKDADRFSTFVDEANAIRLQMALCSDALVITHQSEEQAKRQLRFLGASV